MAPVKYPSITSGLTCDAAEDDDASILAVASLALDPEGDNISLLSDYASLTGGSLYPPGDESLGSSTATRYTSILNVKHSTSLLTQ